MNYYATESVQDEIFAALRQLTPMAIKDVPKIRVGQIGDGGYVMSADIPTSPICYSIGVGPDVSWDIDMANRYEASVFQYDHTVELPPSTHIACHFNKVGLGSHDDFDDLRRLDTLIRENGHQGRDDLFLKCDIEGAEWESLSIFEQGFFEQFDQIVMELHWLDHLHDRAFRRLWKLVVGNIYQSHQSVHVHANNYGGYGIIEGIPIPSVLEVSFARRRGREFIENREYCPGSLDQKNKADAPDYYLGLFRF